MSLPPAVFIRQFQPGNQQSSDILTLRLAVFVRQIQPIGSALQISGGYRKIKIRVGERLVIQSEMPPLTVDRAETVADHDLLQNHSVVILLLGNAPVIRV